MDQYIGKMLDNRYEVLERIGTGGMAVVYKARCHRLNRLVAIKILKPELASDEDFLRRFQSESQAVAMLSHTNIVSIYDVCRSDGLDYIVMELIDGMSLKQYMIKRGTPLNWREALHFITQIVRALGHAHSRGIVHRDIKPHNIMVLRDGSVKVTDFGIARLTSAAQATLTQEALGSVHYISPEQAKGSHVDGRSDLYSVGVMLYEMLTGRLPFEGETPVFVAIQHINSIPISPRDLNPDIPEALEAITMKAMAPNADQRYLTAEDMLEDLKEFRRNPGCPLPKQETKPAEEEVDEPTMVMPVNTIKNEEIAQEGKASEPEKKNAEPKRRQPEEEKVYYERPRRRGMPPVLIGIFAIMVFLVGVIYFLYTFILKDMFTPAQEYVIPDLRGYTIEDITKDQNLLQGFGFEVQITISDSDYDAGEICRQYPVQNTVVKNPDTVIYVTVSTGEQEMFMPDIYNEEARVALNQLQNEMKLKIVEQSEAYSDEVAKGRILSFTPIEGTRVEKGDSVTIVISKGPEPVLIHVLPFIDLDIAQVRSQMDSMNLTVGKVDEFYNDQYAAGKVIWQSIAAGTPVEPGTVIDFHVSKGPMPGVDPDGSGTEDPQPTEDIPLPSEGVELPTTERTVTVDLSAYSSAVHLRIIVGDSMIHDSVVDSSSVPTVTKTVYGSGVQEVFVYVNGRLVENYDLDFNT